MQTVNDNNSQLQQIMKTQISPAAANRNHLGRTLGRVLLLALAALVLQGCASAGAKSSRLSGEGRSRTATFSWENSTPPEPAPLFTLLYVRF
jgi:hypothetical protein